MPQYAMNSRPDSWPHPDTVDLIQSQEAFEKSDAWADAALEWASGDADMLAAIGDRFYCTAAYDRAYAEWMARQ